MNFQYINVSGSPDSASFKDHSMTNQLIEETNSHRVTIFRRVVQVVIKKNRHDARLKLLKKNHNLTSEQIFEGFGSDVNRGSLACFSSFCQAIKNNRKLQELDLSGCTLNMYFAIELANMLQHNTQLSHISLASCKINSFGLSCIFKALAEHQSVKTINLFNNQSFNRNVIEDFCVYILRGKNHIREINLSHCCIEEFSLQILLRNLRHLKSLKRIKIKLMQFQTESILALGDAMIQYTGDRSLDLLDISYNYIKNDGMQLLSKTLLLRVRKINIAELNLTRNYFEHNIETGVQALEEVLDALNQPFEINLSNNKIKEFNKQTLLTKKILRLNLAYNEIREFPNNFFINVISLNLAGNKIEVNGAQDIAAILTHHKVMWNELILNDNFIQTKGFIAIVYALRENRTLQRLAVANNSLDGESILVYLFNHELIKLTYLDLSSNSFRYELVYALIHMMNQCDLRCLILSTLKLEEEDASFKDTFQIKSFNLRELDFSNNRKIIGPILHSLSSQFSQIEYLNLSNCHIHSVVDVGNFCKFLSKCQTLRSLMLSNNQFGTLPKSLYMQFAQSFGKCQSLKMLNLSKNKLGNKVVQLIPLLKQILNLEYLDLSNNQITDYSGKFFCDLIGQTRLRQLNLSYNMVRSTTLDTILQGMSNNMQFNALSLSNQSFTGDDLLSVSNLLHEQGSIKYLDLTGNIKIDKINNFFFLKQNPRVESLTLNKVKITMQRFKDLQMIMINNYRYLKIIEFKNVLLSKENLTAFLIKLREMRQLTALIMDYQIFTEDSISQLLELLIPTLKHLRYLRIRKSQLGPDFFRFLSSLLVDVNKLTDLDLSSNVISEELLSDLGQTLSKTLSLKCLTMRNCNLHDHSFKYLAVGLAYNESIVDIDFSKNCLTYKSYAFFTQLMSDLNRQSQWQRFIMLQNKQVADFNTENSLYQQQRESPNNANMFPRLIYLDVSKNKHSLSFLNRNIHLFRSQSAFCNVQILNFEKSSIDDEFMSYFCKVILLQNLKELNLQSNFITDRGMGLLFQSIFNQEHQLRVLNLSKNQIGDQFLSKLNHDQVLHTSSLVLLRLDRNRITGESCNGFVQLIKQNPNLFIFNNWIRISEELSYLILDGMSRIASEYKVRSNQVPEYLRVFSITDSYITDAFLQSFANQFFKFPFLRVVNFDGNSQITMFGKLYIYINVFNEDYQSYDLQEFYLNDKRTCPIIFDDGIFRFLLITLKSYIMKQDVSDSRQIVKKKYMTIASTVHHNQSKIRWGTVGKVLLDIINRSLNHLQEISRNEFTISTSFINLLKKKQKRVKCWFLINTCLNLVIIFASLFALSQQNYEYQDELIRQEQENCVTQKKQTCIPTSARGKVMAYVFLIVSILSIIMSCINLCQTIYFRIHAEPDYQILTPQSKSFLKSRNPHKKEILWAIFQTVVQLSYFFEFSLISQYWIIYQRHKSRNSNYQQNCFIGFIVSCTILGFKFIFQKTLSLKALKGIYGRDLFNRADYLNAFWSKAQHDFNYILGQFLSSFCPQSGVRLCGVYFSLRQVFDLFQSLFIETLFLSCYVGYIFYSRTLDTGIYFVPDPREPQNMVKINYIQPGEFFVYFGFIKSFVKFCINLYTGITSRPPQIKLQEFNQSLLLRRYNDMTTKHQLLLNQTNNSVSRQPVQRRTISIGGKNDSKTPKQVNFQQPRDLDDEFERQVFQPRRDVDDDMNFSDQVVEKYQEGVSHRIKYNPSQFGDQQGSPDPLFEDQIEDEALAAQIGLPPEKYEKKSFQILEERFKKKHH